MDSSYDVWITSDGTVLALTEMTDSHLRSVVKMVTEWQNDCERELEDTEGWRSNRIQQLEERMHEYDARLNALHAELERRSAVCVTPKRKPTNAS